MSEIRKLSDDINIDNNDFEKKSYICVSNQKIHCRMERDSTVKTARELLSKFEGNLYDKL